MYKYVHYGTFCYGLLGKLRQFWDQVLGVLGLKVGPQSSLFLAPHGTTLFLHSDSIPIQFRFILDHNPKLRKEVITLGSLWQPHAFYEMRGTMWHVLQCLRLQLQAEALLQMRLDGTFDERHLCVLLSLADLGHNSQLHMQS